VSRLAEALAAAAHDLDDLGVAWALVGGLAVSAWCDPRLTRDIDVAVSVSSDKDAERLVRDLQERGYEAIELIEQEATARLATARLVRHARPAILIDVLFASSGIEEEIVRAALTIEVFPGVHVPVASRSHLLALKILARDDRQRPQDHDDLVALLRDATVDDLSETRRAVTLITTRGFNRQRDLPVALDELLRTNHPRTDRN
jgi:hypothetical protein